MSDFNFSEKEKKVLDFWDDHKIFDRSQEIRRSAGRRSFVFFEGPPTANGLPGIHHFLGRAYKDLFCRYKTMRGFFVLRKAGWDTHGLPVEIEVEKELGFKNKKDIEQYGIDKFNKKAKESVWRYKNEWEQMTKRMGFWLDMSDPYITYKNQYIESLWAIIKKIWDKKLLYLAHRVVPFCTRCGTPLSSHEVAQGYKKVTDRSVYVKFKLLPGQKFGINNDITRDSAYVVAWTTTPWTLPGNVALAINKDISYSATLIDGIDELLIVATDLVEKVFAGHKVKTLSTFKGDKISGLEYEPLFDIKELKSDKSYKIYYADFVSTQEGTGVVHTAVMYGEDDYDLGTKIGLPKFHTVDEQGKFIHVGQGLDGMYVKDKETEAKMIGILENNGNLLKTEDYEHDYPFCWRCDTPLLYYAKESWFIKMSAVNKQLLKNNQKINWVPEHIKEGRFGQWLKEGKDWAFSRERYWGTPLPIWKCSDCGETLLAGSLEDLEKNRYKPKNEFYILRHGHSEKNGEKDRLEIVSSKIENDGYHLTEDGKEQIRKVAKQLKKSGGLDMIFASPFIRTRETAKIVGDELGIEVKIEPELQEFQHGSVCEGQFHSVCMAVNHLKNWEDKTADGENWKDVRRRMSGFMREIDSKYESKKILLVSHGDPVWLLETFTLGLTKDETPPTRLEIYPRQGQLKKLDLKNWPYDEDGELDMHRPYIDRIVLKCGKCGGKMSKVPDLIDVWFDSGCMPYAQWHWPFESKKMFKEQFPADFIAEGIDMTRGWFYTLLAVSTLLDKGTPYKNVLSYSHVLDGKGQKMSKSKGNAVSPFAVMEKFGADAPRWYFYTVNEPGDYKLFNEKDVETKLKGFFGTLDNCVRFYELYGRDAEVFSHNSKAGNLLDKWVLSKFYGLVSSVSINLDKYEPTSAARAVEKFVVEDLSNWWLRRSRKRKEALGLLRFILLELIKVIAPFTPFTAEDIH
ncbi:MAG: class I tRNA ligase family protein, partial [Candidatus Yanofskybacteria bacterium]|nr:class I tRNA ligase family protein [Candidatus Yanofskybacteria bacterium]